MATYKKSADPNIIIKVSESEIYLDKLKKQIAELQTQVASAPKIKTKPDQETLDMWNSFIPESGAEELQAKKDLLRQLEAL